MGEKTVRKFTVKLNNGDQVNVKWYPDYFTGADHLELRGTMTSTGYRSEFINRGEDEQLEPEMVMEHARKVAQECWDNNGEKYGVHLSLL